VNPSYWEVCTGTTGHAEVVQVTFDPGIIGFGQLLDVFFLTHDPTTLNRQGADIGIQYRSVIFYHDEAQKKTAEQVLTKWQVSGRWKDPIVTEISPFGGFYPAEDDHRDYFLRNPNQPYCRFTIAPKVEKLEDLIRSLLGKPDSG